MNMFYLNENIECKCLYLLDESEINDIYISLSKLIADELNLSFKDEINQNQLFIHATILDHFCSKCETMTISLNVKKLSKDSLNIFLNLMRDSLGYPQNVYFNILCRKDQEQEVYKSKRVSDFFVKRRHS